MRPHRRPPTRQPRRPHRTRRHRPATDEPTELLAPVQDQPGAPERELTGKQRELLLGLYDTGSADWVTASTLGAANGVSQIVNHLPGLIEKTGGGSEHWEGPLQVRLTEAGRQLCERLRPPAPEPVPLADTEVREMLRGYLEDLTDSQRLSDFAQEYLGDRVFDAPWPAVVARCWPPEPIEVRANGEVIGTLSFTPAAPLLAAEPEAPPPAETSGEADFTEAAEAAGPRRQPAQSPASSPAAPRHGRSGITGRNENSIRARSGYCHTRPW